MAKKKAEPLAEKPGLFPPIENVPLTDAEDDDWLRTDARVVGRTAPLAHLQKIAENAPDPPLSPAELNARHREFWDGETKRFESAIRKRPKDAVIAARLLTEQMQVSGPALTRGSMESFVAAIAESHEAKNQATARDGGTASGESRKEQADTEWRDRCVTRAREILASGSIAPRNVSATLAGTFGKSDRQIRNVLQGAGVLMKKEEAN